MNPTNSKIFDPHRLLVNLTDETNLKKVINMILHQTLAFTIHGKTWKSHTKLKNLKYQL